MTGQDQRIDDYVLGRLAGEEAERFEASLADDQDLKDHVAQAARLVGCLHRLGAEVLDEPVPESMLRLLAGAR